MAGFDHVLFAGVPAETDSERKARLDVAREVLVELCIEDPLAARDAATLMSAHEPTRRAEL